MRNDKWRVASGGKTAGWRERAIRSRHSSPVTRHSSAFTLIELLVVIRQEKLSVRLKAGIPPRRPWLATSRRFLRKPFGKSPMTCVQRGFVAAAAAVLIARAAAQGEERPAVGPPPESFFALVNQRDRDTARQFYGKYVDIKGIPVVSSAEVADLALQRTHEIVSHLLAGRPDVIAAMRSNGMYLIIIGKD